MKVESVKLILDACFEANRLEACLPPLPPGITPRCMRVIEQIAIRSRENQRIQVSTISEMLDVTRPGITAVLRELTEMGYVKKERDTQDSRVVYVSLTEIGWKLYRIGIEEYHAHLAEVLKSIGDDGALALKRTVREVMCLIAEDTKRMI